MKKYILSVALLFVCSTSKADLWGGDLPLLAQIVTNTMNTLLQLQQQTRLMQDEMDGIKDRINRIQTIADIVQPSTWDKWKDPLEALNRLRLIYRTLPKEYRSEKADAVEDEISRAMNAIARISPGVNASFLSGKELEQRGAASSPGVAQKLTASGVGTLVAMESQNLVLQSHITSLLTQMLAQGNERESRMVISRGTGFNSIAKNLDSHDGKFSTHVFPLGVR